MFLQWLPTDQGMLFPAGRTTRHAHVDEEHADSTGYAVHRRQGAHRRDPRPCNPRSEDIIASPTAVKAVLELAGGECAALGIHVGDQVRHKLFGTATPGPARN